jgi:hypothetical protein
MVLPNMALQRTHRPRFFKVQFSLGTTGSVQEHAGMGRSLRSLGAPLNARPFGDQIRTLSGPHPMSYIRSTSES